MAPPAGTTSATQAHRAAVWMALDFFQAVLTGEVANVVDIGGIGAIAITKGFARFVRLGWPGGWAGRIATTAQHNGDLHRVVGVVGTEITSLAGEVLGGHGYCDSGDGEGLKGALAVVAVACDRRRLFKPSSAAKACGVATNQARRRGVEWRFRFAWFETSDELSRCPPSSYAP